MLNFSTPILLLCWRRPHTLKKVFDAIRPIAPSSLYIACDGPNPSRIGETDLVLETRALIDNSIDWPCTINRLYSEVNLGCRFGVSRAISWFFEHVDEGIILEDDCVPHQDFFHYCRLLLEHYRDDQRIWSISGNNFQDGNWRGDGHYYFSRYNHCWGWATWRRCWIHYDSDLVKFIELANSDLSDSIFDDKYEWTYWCKIWQGMLETGKPDSWAYRWAFTCFLNGGLTTLPNRNLVSNIGFGDDATNTKKGSTILTDGGIDPTRHPTFILRHSAADRYTFDYFLRGRFERPPFLYLKYPLILIRFIIRTILRR